MSQLDHAKRQAKRLFNIAKTNSTEDNINLPFKNLSSAKEYVAIMNGYKHWHDYEENLKRKDFISDKTDKNTINKTIKATLIEQKYFLQDIKINSILLNNQSETPIQYINHAEHIPIVLGSQISNNLLFSKSKDKKWIIKDYPLCICGSTGAGRTETILNLAYQYIQNKEGLIYFDGKGDTNLYSKIFYETKTQNRLNDLYVINFLQSLNHTHENSIELKNKQTHSIDPINPMIGNEHYFIKFLGEPIGKMIHSLLIQLKEKQIIIDTQTLESFLMLPHLIQLSKSSYFSDSILLNSYLTNLGFSLNENQNDSDYEKILEAHSLNCIKAKNFVSLLKTFSHIFKCNPNISIKNIFLNKKILVVLLPALERSEEEISTLGSLISEQIAYFDKSLSNINQHLINIVLDEFPYYIKDNTNNWDSILNNSKNNYIFSTYDFYNSENIGFLNKVLNLSKTTIMMKASTPNLIPKKVKLDIIENMKTIPPIIYCEKNNQYIDKCGPLRELNEGKAYVFCNNSQESTDDSILNKTKEYYVEKIQCGYHSPKKQGNFYVVEHNYI